METGQLPIASDIIRGQKRINDNPSIKAQIGQSSDDMSMSFNSIVGASLAGIAPDQRQAIQDAALAHYVETYVSKGAEGFNNAAYTKSVQSVIGGDRVQDVNGQKVVLPAGVTGGDVEAAFEVMSDADWQAAGVQGLPPSYVDGTPALAEDLEYEAALQAVGGGVYRVMVSDGSYLVTGREVNGRSEAYLMHLDANKVKALAAPKAYRPEGAGYSPGPLGGGWPDVAPDAPASDVSPFQAYDDAVELAATGPARNAAGEDGGVAGAAYSPSGMQALGAETGGGVALPSNDKSPGQALAERQNYNIRRAATRPAERLLKGVRPPELTKEDIDALFDKYMRRGRT